MNWDYLIKILDVIVCIGTIVCLNLVVKYFKVWLLYSFVTALCIIVTVYNRIPGLSIMGIFLLVTGLRNYWIERKKKLQA